ncbi:hypothetical protein BW737_001625 [Actinomyces ruminis]|uniref:Uncharacterized protein n=1 Tax=Actinomyces ruminis TaxID=1937003 RepID=A0ABX4MDU1_9ACTO|nr:hypothetical protein BW737_001625 [Actinomyces ruminis]
MLGQFGVQPGGDRVRRHPGGTGLVQAEKFGAGGELDDAGGRAALQPEGGGGSVQRPHAHTTGAQDLTALASPIG